jgi:hypothetical protein
MYIIYKDKNVKKKSQRSRNQGFSNFFCLVIKGSGSKRLKNMWVRWIRIRVRNTGAGTGVKSQNITLSHTP